MPDATEQTNAAARDRLRGFSFRQQQQFIVLAAVLPVLALALVLLVWGVQQYRSAVEGGLGDTVQALATAADRQIMGLNEVLYALSMSRSFNDGDFSTFHGQASAVAQRHSATIIVFDRSLQQVMSTAQRYGAVLPKVPYSASVHEVFASGNPLVRGPFVGEVAPNHVVSIDFPVVRGGEVVYDLNLSFDPSILRALLAAQDLPDGWSARITNEENRFVATGGSDGADLIGRRASNDFAAALRDDDSRIFVGPARDGETQIIAYQRLTEAPWVVSVAVPEAQLAAARLRPILFFGAVALLAIIAAVGTAWLFSLRVTRPLDELARTAADVMQGGAATTARMEIPEFEMLRQALEHAGRSFREATAAEAKAAAAEAMVESLRESEERQRLLAREVDHRAKNLLAVVQSILELTRAEDIDSYVATATGRVMALARAHSLLAMSRWEGANLGSILADELEPYRTEGSAVDVSGPNVTLLPSAAQSMALALHELTTNAVKYGALSRRGGRLSVAWWTSDEDLTLTWLETGAPGIQEPPQKGFGMTMIAASVRQQLSGDVDFDWRPEGLRATLTVPGKHLADKDAAVDGYGLDDVAQDSFVDQSGALAGRRVLVVEDEALIAADISAALEDDEVQVVGPASTMAQALALLSDMPADAAVIDLNLAGESSEPLARELVTRGIPFVVVTGYADAGLSDVFDDVPLIPKPFQHRTLLTLLSRELARASSGA